MKRKRITTERERKAIRRWIDATQPQGALPPILVLPGDSAPEVLGDGWMYTTRTGRRIQHPSAYSKVGWSSMVYVHSTRRTEVGAQWLARALGAECRAATIVGAGLQALGSIMPCIAYKALALDPSGRLRSFFDGSEYQCGVAREEPARPEHGGGFYVYNTPEEAYSTYFPKFSACLLLPQVIVAVEVSGRSISYGRKIAVSRIVPLLVLSGCKRSAETLFPEEVSNG